MSSKVFVPFLSINLHFKEIVQCAASVSGVNVKKNNFTDFSFFSVMPGGINTCLSQPFIPITAPSLIGYISFFLFLNFILFWVCSAAYVFHHPCSDFLNSFPLPNFLPSGSMNPPVPKGNSIEF